MKTEYLGFWVNNKGVVPISSKVDAIDKIEVRTNVCDLSIFVGIVYYHRDMWYKRAHTLAPFTKINVLLK